MLLRRTDYWTVGLSGCWIIGLTPVSSTNKTDRHDITEILLKVALNTITLRDIVYQLRNFFIPKIIVDFRTDLHKMKINTELCCKRYEKDQKLSLSELLSG